MRRAPDRGATLGEYLRRDSPAQRRVLALMADGHGRRKHGQELGGPSRSAYQRRVADHLERASVAFEVTGHDGRPLYLVANPRTGDAAWLTPHKEHRSTFFKTWEGFAGYVDRTRQAKPAQVWRPLDLHRIRDAASRPAARRIVSAAHSAARSGPAR